MFSVKNLRTGNFIKNAIDRKVFVYESMEDAQTVAASMNVFAVADRKQDRYVAIKVKEEERMEDFKGFSDLVELLTALHKDAERYRFLRNTDLFEDGALIVSELHTGKAFSGTDLDATIDRVLANREKA